MRPQVLVVLLIALAAGAAACAQPRQGAGIASAGSATVTASPGAGVRYADPNAKIDTQGWIRCLRQHGLTVDDPTEPDGKPRIHDELTTREKVDAAAEACRRYNPNWGLPNPPSFDREVQDQLRRFAQCMRAHGIPWDDPDPNAGTASGAPEPAGPTPGGPAFDRAVHECATRVPGVVVDNTGPKK
jgi:hypothetical protein